MPQEVFVWCPSRGLGCGAQHHPTNLAGHILVRSASPRDKSQSQDLDPSSLPLGPFKPFFGSSIKIKVQYEGGELKRVAPPLLSSVLTCLSLVNWATPEGSNLARLIYGIMTIMTDFDPLSCIPETSSIAGTVEHRFQDQRTSHSSTLFILWTASSYLSVFTSSFSPVNIDYCLGSVNYNLSFQTCFTYISTMYSCLLNLSPKSLNSCYHLHVKCLNCIQPVYEQDLDIDDPDRFLDSQNDLIDETNRWCWVSKDKLMIRIKEAADPLLQTEVWNEVTYPQEGLIRSTADFYFKEFPLPSISGYREHVC